MRIHGPFSALAALALAAGGAAAQVVVIEVPQDYPTIQEAIDHVPTGGQVQVNGGTYGESVLVEGKDQIVLFAKGKVTMVPPMGQPAITFHDCSVVTLQQINVTGGGIHFDGCSGALIFKCKVTGTEGDGIRLDDSTGVTVTACKVTGAGGDGIALGTGQVEPSDANLIVANKIITPVGAGVSVHGSFNLVDSNLISKAGGDGITMEDGTTGDQNTFQANKVLQPGHHGIVVTGGDHDNVRDNKLVKCAGDGVRLLGGANHFVESNKVTAPLGDGIFCDPAAATVTCNENKVSKPQDDGLDIEGDGCALDLNTVKAALGNGFEVDGDGGTYTGNIASKSQVDGFQLNGTANTLSTNTAKGSKGFDLDELAGGNTVDATNVFKTHNP
jgi:hypothetical protein